MAVSYDTVRSAAPIWYMRIVQLVLAVIVLGITGNTASEWHTLACNTPVNVAFNIACAALTLPAVIYLLASSGPKISTHFLPWNQWAQLGLDALLFVFWLAATGASPYTCAGLCSACSALGSLLDDGYGYNIWARSKTCTCFEAGDSEARRLVKKSLDGRAISPSTEVTVKLDKLAVMQVFDTLMLFGFVVAIALTAYRIFMARKAATADAHGVPLEVQHEVVPPWEDNIGDKGYPATVNQSVP